MKNGKKETKLLSKHNIFVKKRNKVHKKILHVLYYIAKNKL